MAKKIIVFTFICIVAVGLKPSRAKATAAIPLDGVTEVIVTFQYKTGIFPVCGGVYLYNYQQLMAIPGKGMVWVPVSNLYTAGPQQATLSEKCDNGDYIYDLGSCNC